MALPVCRRCFDLRYVFNGVFSRSAFGVTTDLSCRLALVGISSRPLVGRRVYFRSHRGYDRKDVFLVIARQQRIQPLYHS